MVQYLLISLFAAQLFLVSPFVIEKEEEPSSLKGNKNASESSDPEAPSFLLTIYNQTTAENKAHGEALLLQTFQAEWDQEAKEFYLLPSLVIKPSETVHKAELFLSTDGLAARELTVSIYETQTGTEVSSRHLSSNRSGWLPLPVTTMIKQWIPQDAPLRFKIFVKVRSGSESVEADHMQVPRVWLVVYTEGNHEHPFPNLAPDEAIRGSAGDRRRRDVTPPPPKMAESKNVCRREDLIVGSKNLTEYVKIIYPRSFNAYQCTGKCSETDKANFVNHSILKSLVLQVKGIKSEDKPCCAATKLKPISIIYRTDNGFMIRTVQNLIVEECGCH